MIQNLMILGLDHTPILLYGCIDSKLISHVLSLATPYVQNIHLCSVPKILLVLSIMQVSKSVYFTLEIGPISRFVLHVSRNNFTAVLSIRWVIYYKKHLFLHKAVSDAVVFIHVLRRDSSSIIQDGEDPCCPMPCDEDAYPPRAISHVQPHPHPMEDPVSFVYIYIYKITKVATLEGDE